MKKVKVLVLTVLASITPVAGVYAHTNDSILNVTQVEQQDVQIQPQPIEWEKKCRVVDTNLDGKIAEFTARRDTHLGKYQQVVEKFEAIIAKLSEAGFNTDTLVALMPELTTRIAVFDNTATKMIAELELANTNSCNNYSLFAIDLQDSRAGLKGTRLAASDIREYVIDVLIPEVRNVISEAR